MTWTLSVSGHKEGNPETQNEEVKEAVRELVRKLRGTGHTVSVHTVNGEDVEAQ